MASHEVEALHRNANRAFRDGAFESSHGYCLELLRRDPEFADAYFLLGMIAAAHGNTIKALELIERALQREPRRPEYLAQKSRFLLLLNHTRSALETAKQALELAPSDALTLDTIGVVLSKAGDHEASISAFELAVEKLPGNPQFHFNLGSSRQFLGRFDSARESYQNALRLKPDFFRAHWALSELGPAVATREVTDRLESLLERHSDNPDAVRYLSHALAREYERLGEFSRAFALWQRGKAAAGQKAVASYEDNRALFEEIAAICTSDFVHAGRGHESMEPIFIVGMPRTGTTLVEHMLGSLDDVFAAGELDDFGISLKRATQSKSNRVLDIETVRAARHIDFAAVGRDYIDRTRPRTGHTARFIDKLPPNFLYAGFIHRALPQARIICLKRNPLDTCLSNYRQLFSERSPYYAYASDLLATGRYFLLFEALIAHWQEVLPRESFLLTSYESLVSNPDSEARRIVEFCGLAWDDRVLDFHNSGQPAATASAVQVRNPIYKDAVGRWKRYEREIEPLLALFAERGLEDCTD